MSNIASNERLRRISLLAALVAPVLTACGGGSGSSSLPPLPAPLTALSLFAGNADGPGNQDGPASAARFSLSVRGLAVAPNGDLVIADTDNNAIRKLSGAGQFADGIVVSICNHQISIGSNSQSTNREAEAGCGGGPILVARAVCIAREQGQRS